MKAREKSMLNPNNDRLDYGQVLAPPSNHKLDFAIGTTYSLDLDALVGACIALGLAEETDSESPKGSRRADGAGHRFKNNKQAYV